MRHRGDRRRSWWSIPIGRIAGIPITLHVTFVLLIALVVASPGRDGIGFGLLWVLAVFASVVVHELAHSVVARARGGTVKEILLLPIGGMSEIEHLPEGWANELAVAAVGPLTSVGVAAILAAIAALTGTPLWPPHLFAGGNWLTRIMWANLLLAGFNLLPAFPLDGGRVLRALIERRHGLAVANHTAAVLGRIAGTLMVLVGLAWDLWLSVIGVLIILGATGEEALTETHIRLRGVPARALMRVAYDQIDAREPLPFPAAPDRSWVVTVSGAYLGMAQGRDLAFTHSGSAGDVTDPATPLGPEQDMGRSGLDALLARSDHVLPVVDHGRVLGVVRLADVSTWLNDHTRVAS